MAKQPSHQLASSISYINKLYARHLHFSSKKRIDFYRMLYTLTSNGVSIQSALTLIKSKLEQLKQRNNPINIIIRDILYTMRKGVPFHRALEQWIPNSEYVLIEASYQDITRAFSIVIQHTENLYLIRSALQSSLTYPLMMFFLLIITMGALSFYIMPNMAKLASPEHWPPLSHNLYIFTQFVRSNYIAIASILLILTVFIMWSLPNLTLSGFRAALDRVPPWNIYKAYTATSFLIALASSIKLGSSFNSSILHLYSVSKPYLRKFLQKIKIRLMSGSNFGDAIDISIFDTMTLVSLSVFAITNKLEQGVQYIAENNLEEQKQELIRRGKMLGYIMMAFVAIMIGWIVLAMYGMQSSVTA